MPTTTASSVLGSSDGTYNKRHLVPFGEDFEFLPQWVKSLLRDMDSAVFELQLRRRRPAACCAPQVIRWARPSATRMPIGNEIMRALPEAAFLVNVSNDGWFGDSIALPQHLEIARMRAIESGRWSAARHQHRHHRHRRRRGAGCRPERLPTRCMC